MGSDFDSFMWGIYPASLQNVGGSARLPARVRNNKRRGSLGIRPPQIKPANVAIYPMQYQFDLKSNKTKKSET